MTTCNSVAYRILCSSLLMIALARGANAQKQATPTPTPPLQQVPTPPAQPVPTPTPTPSPQPSPTGQQVAAPPQTIACDECVKGDQLLSNLNDAGRTLRERGDELVRVWVPLQIEGNTVPPPIEERLREYLRGNSDVRDAVDHLYDVTDEQLLQIGYALCKSPDATCARYMMGALHFAREYAPTSVGEPYDLPNHGLPYGLPPATCDPYVNRVRSPKMGFGAEYATGWQDSAKPTDGRAWSIGLEARARVTNAIGFVARVDRSTGRDESIDDDGDGRDDSQAGTITRWTMMVGPSLRLSEHRVRDMGRFWQVDSLVGFSRDASRSGPIVALDLSYQFVVARLGVRVMSGFGDAREESSLLVHSGLQFGAGPQYSYGAGCGVEERARGSAWAIAFDLPLSGVTSEGDYITPGFGLEGAYHFHEYVDGLVRGDVLAMPHGDRERALHQSLLVGARFDAHGKHTDRNMFGTLAVGYDHVATTSSDPIQSGPVVEASIGYGMQKSDGAAWLRVHGRFGVSPDNSDLRAYFLSFGTELRLDRNRWRDRN
jgi:hypothetical protein